MPSLATASGSAGAHAPAWLGPTETAHGQKRHGNYSGGPGVEYQRDPHEVRIPGHSARGHARADADDGSRRCETHTARNRPMIHIDFDAADYLPCPVRARCTRARTDAGACSLTVQSRTETVQSRTEWEALVTCRARQQPPSLKAYGRLISAKLGIAG